MPTHQRIRGDEGGNRVQRPSPEALGLHRQSTTLIVSQPELPATKLLFEDPVLLDQVGDNILLMPMHPARNRQQEQLERESRGRHSAIVGALNSHAHRQLRTDPFLHRAGLTPRSERNRPASIRGAVRAACAMALRGTNRRGAFAKRQTDNALRTYVGTWLLRGHDHRLR